MNSGGALLWILLILLAAGSVFLLLPALMRKRTEDTGDTRADHDFEVYRDQLAEVDHDLERGLLTPEQAQSIRLEVEHRLLVADRQRRGGARPRGSGAPSSAARRLTLAAVVVFLPLGAFSLYLPLGSPGLPGQPFAENRLPAVHGSGGDTPEGMPSQAQIGEMVANLTARLEDSPGEPEDWRLLTRSYMAMGQLKEARAALEKAITHFPDNVPLLSSLARIVLAEGNQGDSEVIVVPKEAAELFSKVLTIEPKDNDALWFLGLAEAQAGRRENAVRLWRRLLDLLPEDSLNRPVLEERIREVEDGG